VVACGGTDGHTDRQTDRWADMMKTRVAFRNFASAPKNELNLYTEEISVCSVSNMHTKREMNCVTEM
jgi:hypothetical protein